MKHFFRHSFLSLVALFSACSDSGSSAQSFAEDESHLGMVKIAASGKAVVLGTNELNAPASERPEMRAVFDYDFSIGMHEVTQEEFGALMKNFKSYDEGDSLPVVRVTFFDAVLFANERSKAEHLDTCYSYTLAKFDSAGNCVNLDGLVFNPAIEGYRLPTEAEWVFAATPSWNMSNAWNNENSQFRRHAVCSISKNDFGICDMAGNVMEWVNDWLGYYSDTAVVNYLGASDGGNLGERIVKGGYYGTEPANMNLHSRGDVYTVLSSSKYDYVGFRLAFGAIENGVWTNSSGAAVSKRIIPLAGATSLRNVSGTRKMKLAFRDDVSGNLNFIDYNKGTLSVHEFADTIDVYHPEISPDGKYVAFCTRPEGVSGASTLYVRKLSKDENFIMRLDVESAAVPRWTVSDGDTSIVYVTDASSNKDETAWKRQSTWQVPFAGEKFGNPQKLFDGTFNGGVSDDMRLAVSGSTLLRARMTDADAPRDTVWYGGEQACNVSLSKDGSKRTLFLDFSGKTGKSFTKENYATHGRILIADSLGKLIQSVKASSGYTFDHTEWTNRENLVVATLTNVNGAHEKIVLVDTRDSNIIDLVSGDELWHPNLWIQDAFVLDSSVSVLDADSAGQYFADNGSDAAAVLRAKMELFWKYKDSVNTVIFGSSRPSTCVDPLLFSEKFRAVNLSLVPNIVYESRYIFENYVLNHVKNLEYLVISLDIDLWFRSENNPPENFFAEEYKSYPGFVYDANHGFWKDESPKGMAEYAENCVYNEFERTRHTYHRGVQRIEESPDFSWEGENPGVDFDSTWLVNLRTEYEDNFNDLKAIIEKSAERGIKVVGVVFPQSPGYKNTGAFGRYGLRRSDAKKILQELADLENEYGNFKFLDENKMGDHDYPDSLAINRDHLQNKAAKIMTPRIEAVLQSF